jgi:tetratricopeptide (TPR) repeat protein
MTPLPLSRRGPGRAIVLFAALGLAAFAVLWPGDAPTARAGPDPLPAGTEIRTGAGERRRESLSDGSVLFVNQGTVVRVESDARLSLSSGEVFVEAAADAGREPLVVRAPGREVSGRGARFVVRADDTGAAVVAVGGRVKVKGLDAPLSPGQQLTPGSDKPGAALRLSHVLEWTRELTEETRPALVPHSSYSGGALVAVDPDGQEARLSLRKYHVDVHVEDGFARTTIDQTYFNEANRRLEGTFYFPLPPDASLSRLAMYVDGTLMEGGMAERDYARSVYETVLYQAKDPALLEWVDGSTFKMRVFPLEPRQEKRLILSYTQKLPALYGQTSYRFPAGHSLNRVGEWSFHALVKSGAKMGWACPSHTLQPRADGADLLLDAAEKGARPNRDVVLTLTEPGKDGNAEAARFSSAEADGAKYLMLRYRPALSALAAARKPRNWVFLFESSGDRDALLARTQIEVIRGLLAHAEPEDTFIVLAANTRARACFDKPRPVTPANVRQAVKFLEESRKLGALDLGGALAASEPFLKAGGDSYLVHVGCGIAALGERRDDVLAAKVPERARYVGVGVGKRWSRDFLKAAAERTGGHFTQINPDEPVAWRAFDLATTLDIPRLLGVRVADDSGADFLTVTSAVAQGEEVCAVARCEKGKALPEKVVVTGLLDGQPWRRELAVKDAAPDAGYLPWTWAKLEIERLLAEDAAKHKARIIELSKAAYVVTPFTSLLVLENEEMYARYKVDRGRKDHWAMYPCPAKIPVVSEPVPGPPPGTAKDARPEPAQVLRTVLVRLAPRPLLLPGDPEGAPSPPSRHYADGEWFLNTLRPSRAVTEPQGEMWFPEIGRSPQGTVGDRRVREASGGTPDIQEQIEQLRPDDRVRWGSSWKADPDTIDAAVARLFHDGGGRFVLPYRRPSYNADDGLFTDLVSYAPGLNTSLADLRAVAEEEAAADARPGEVDAAARRLIDGARAAGWQSLTLETGAGAAVPVLFDGPGNFAYERTLPSGLRERVVCDGKTLLHLYPDLGLGARRTVSHFHRTEFAHVVPWALPPTDDLARGNDVRLVGERTVAVVPLGSDLPVRPAGLVGPVRPPDAVCQHLVFAKDGRLVERRLVRTPGDRVLSREVYAADGSVRALDADGKEVRAWRGKLTPARAPDLAPDTRAFVVLPLPYRTADRVRKALRVEPKDDGRLRGDDALALLSAHVAAHRGKEAAEVCRRSFLTLGDRRPGLFVMLAACGESLDEGDLDVLAAHPNDPLAEYLALHTSPLLRNRAARWAVAAGAWEDGFLRRLAEAHAVADRWLAPAGLDLPAARRTAEIDRAAECVRQHKGTYLGCALLCLMAEQAGDDRALNQTVAGLWPLFEDVPGLGYAADYERARSLWRAGRREDARARFRALYEKTLDTGTPPPLDEDFRAALAGDGNEKDLWTPLVRDTAARLVDRGRRADVLRLADQCRQLGDDALADTLAAAAVEGAPGGPDGAPLRLAAVQFRLQTGHPEEADRLLRGLLDDRLLSRHPALWRAAALLADRRGQRARALSCLEISLDLAYEDRPDTINLDAVRSDYAGLLERYDRLAEAATTLGVAVPDGFRAKVERAADRWRSLDPDPEPACRAAAEVLRTLGERDAAWDYLTTALALRPRDAGPWLDLARTLADWGDDRADQAYAAAFAAEPTDAGLLWERAERLRQAGKRSEAEKLYRQLAEGTWEPRFAGLPGRARDRLGGR